MSDSRSSVSAHAQRVAIFVVLAGLFGFSAKSFAKETPPAPKPAAEVPASAEDAALLRSALVKLRVTSQGFDMREPWRKSSVSTRIGRGVVVAPGRILTFSNLVSRAISIEVMEANSTRRFEAKLFHKDRDLGLALVDVDDDKLRERLKPLALGQTAKLDDVLHVAQLGQDNMVERYRATVARVEATRNTLMYRCKTTLADSGNGQAVLSDGKLVGLVRSTNRFRQEGQVLSLDSIRHYLDDLEDGHYAGLPGRGQWIHYLMRDDLRRHFKVPDDQHGVVISRVTPGYIGHGTFEPGDVVTHVDGYDIDDEGMFRHKVHGRLYFWYLLRGQRHAGDSVTVRILRDGTPQDVSLKLGKRAPEHELIPDSADDGRTEFLVICGFVILQMHGGMSAGRGGGADIIRRLSERDGWDTGEPGRRIVFIDHVLPDPSNKGFETMRNHALRTVNGKRILTISDVEDALKSPEGEFHVFQLEGLESDIAIPAAEVASINERIAKNYRVTTSKFIREAEDTESEDNGGGQDGATK